SHSYLPSFPTRRSSDLFQKIYDHGWLDRKVYVLKNAQLGHDNSYHAAGHVKKGTSAVTRLDRSRHLKEAGIIPRSGQGRNISHRSEEHTSELQSLTNLV